MADPNEPIVVAQGHWGKVECVVRPSGKSPSKEYLDELKEFYIGRKEKSVTAYAKFLVLFQEMANHGRMRAKRFGPESDGLYAFKHELKNKQIRFACFRDENKWMLTHGFEKPGAKKGRGPWPQTQIDKAKAIRKEYFENKPEREPTNGQDTR